MFRNIFVSLLIFFVTFNAVSYLRETQMLSGDELKINHINNEQHKPFYLSTLMDDPLHLQANGKVTILYFFAPWCKICHISIDNLEDFYLENENVEVIAVALDYENKSEITEFSKDHQLTFPIALGNAAVKKTFKISGYPSYYILDGDNNIISKSMGYTSKWGLYLRTFFEL